MSNIRDFATRIETLHAERDTLADDVKEIYDEARAEHIDVKALRAAIAYRRKVAKDPAAAEELEARVHEYLHEIETGTQIATRVRAREVGASLPVAPAADLEIPSYLDRRGERAAS